jgi:hypothetical protein
MALPEKIPFSILSLTLYVLYCINVGPRSFAFKMNAHEARLNLSDHHSQFCSASQNLGRAKQRDSNSSSPYNNLASSESTQSDDRSIFNAIRVVTPDGPSTRFYASLSQENPVHEQGLAVNMARFVPTNLQDSSPVHHIPRKELKAAGKLGGRAKMLSDQHWHTTHRPEPSKVTLPDFDRCLHRKAVSLGANDCSRGPKWPGTTHPAVIPVQPRYPPPERSPTPPGLPSFGSPEAMRYSARFLVRDHGTYARANAQGPAENQRSTSYGEALRRLFGLPATPPRIDARSVTGIGRAQDGTMVLGRFPYRQSGHGTNVVRQLHDHPYHRRLPVARHEAVDTAHDPCLEAARAKSAGTGLPRCSQFFNPPPRRRPLSPGSGFSFPSNPTSAVVARPQQGRARALVGLPRNLSAPEGLARTMHADPVISSAQASRDTAGHLPSALSRLRSVRSAARASDSTRGDSIRDHPTRTTIRSTLVSWFKFQQCACCCLRGLEEPDESLGAVTSHDTYATARSQVSPAASQADDAQAASLQTWISSVYSVMFPNFVNRTTV